MIDTLAITRFTSQDAIDSLSERELSNATFLIVCALAERLTGKVPCLALPRGEIPSLIHGADGHVTWLEPPEELEQKI